MDSTEVEPKRCFPHSVDDPPTTLQIGGNPSSDVEIAGKNSTKPVIWKFGNQPAYYSNSTGGVGGWKECDENYEPLKKKIMGPPKMHPPRVVTTKQGKTYHFERQRGSLVSSYVPDERDVVPYPPGSAQWVRFIRGPPKYPPKGWVDKPDMVEAARLGAEYKAKRESSEPASIGGEEI